MLSDLFFIMSPEQARPPKILRERKPADVVDIETAASADIETFERGGKYWPDNRERRDSRKGRVPSAVDSLSVAASKSSLREYKKDQRQVALADKGARVGKVKLLQI